MIEHEVKLQFDDVEAARRAVTRAEGRLVASRRLIDDRFFDTPDSALRRAGISLRVRRDAERAFITLKGPIQPGPVKMRDEQETLIGSAATMETALAMLGYRPVFRSQKYREEFEIGLSHIAIDDTPFGTFLEIEALPEEIARVTPLIGRTPADYRLESYSTLWRQWCEARGLSPRDMLFDAPAAAR